MACGVRAGRSLCSRTGCLNWPTWPPPRHPTRRLRQRLCVAECTPALIGLASHGFATCRHIKWPPRRHEWNCNRYSTGAATTVGSNHSIGMIEFLGSAGGPFLRPGLIVVRCRAEPRSRMAAGHREAARSVLDGGEHGTKLEQDGPDPPPHDNPAAQRLPWRAARSSPLASD